MYFTASSYSTMTHKGNVMGFSLNGVTYIVRLRFGSVYSTPINIFLYHLIKGFQSNLCFLTLQASAVKQ